jgi:signal transduction histidine kinase
MPYIVKDKIAFLSSASKILASSLDYNVTLVSVAKLVVESVADFCMIDLLDGEKLNRVAVKMSDPKKNILAQQFYNFPPDPRNRYAIYDTLRLGLPIIIKKVNKKWLKTISRLPEEKQLVEKLNFSSFIFLPLQSTGKIIGVITIASTEKNFYYTEDDAIFIKELADRAGITVDKARLFSEAQEAIRIRDEFLSIASHELKTPLTSVLLSLQLILRRLQKTTSKSLASVEILKAVEVSIEQSKRMSRLINDLLDVSLTTSEYFNIDVTPVDLTSLIEDAYSRFDILLSNKKIKLIINENHKHIVGYWDRIRIEQVITNLISNAIKYGKGKPIYLETERLKNYAIIKVKDEGIGIREEDKSKIFQVFTRSSEVRSFKGIGVGLYISNKIVQAHGGEINVKSDYGKGSEFIVKLPLKQKK